MSETIIDCACINPHCPLTMKVMWGATDISVLVEDEDGGWDRQNFTYTDFVTLLENLDVTPNIDDETDVYYYEFTGSLRLGAAGETNTIMIADRNYNFLIQHTKDVLNATVAP